MADDQAPRGTDRGVAVIRRAPFSDNPNVGARGQRTQQRILDAALRAFAEDGYHGCSVDRITKLARCSRVSFYQYFESKEDLFGHLARQVARQVSAFTEVLDPLTPDVSGWEAMRAWIERFVETHERFEPVFHAYESDPSLAAVAQSTGREITGKFHARLTTATLPPRELDPVIRLLLQVVNHTLDVRGILRHVEPAAYPSEQIEIALTDVIHRTLFGLRPDINVHSVAGAPPPAIELGPGLRDLLADAQPEPDPSVNRAQIALLDSARDVFVARGYQNTRVDDLVAAAGVSHGAFYRYFGNKDEIARVLTARATRVVGSTVVDLPPVADVIAPGGRGALRRWLRRYAATHAQEAAMLQVWVDAALQNPILRDESAPVLDGGRRGMARYLQDRGFGDVAVEALVMVALLGVLGARFNPAPDIDAAAYIVERGLLGR